MHKKPSAYLVYVHLGLNPSPTLIEFCKQSAENLRDSSPILISDHPENWMEFPGVVIEPKSKGKIRLGLSEFKKRNPEKRTIANGYWLYTFERLFSLKTIESYIEKDVPIIHLESDVVSYINQELLSVINERVHSISVPRFNDEAGVGSLIYFPDWKALEKFENELDCTLEENPELDNDMNLLGTMLNSRILQELPSGRASILECTLRYQEFNVLIDGAGIGQYLFGQDPLHTKNRRISGFQNPFHPVNFANAKWSITKIDNKEFVTFEYKYEKFLVAATHVHSKAIIPPVSSNSDFWQKCLAEANGEVARTESELIPDVIHSGKISIFNRLRIARKKGLYGSLKKKILILIKNEEVSS